MLCRCLIHIEKLSLRAAPGAFVGAVIGIKIRLVPDLPVFDIQIETVSPAVIIMTDNMLADNSPFFKVLRRNSSVLFDLVLDSLSQSEKGFCPCVKSGQYAFVGAGKIIGIRIFGISVKVRKYGGDIMRIRAAVNRTA